MLLAGGVCFPGDVLILCRHFGVSSAHYVHMLCLCVSLTCISGLNNRYGLDLIWTVLVMAEGTDTGEMPSFDPSPSSEAKKRPTSSDGSE